MPNAKIRPRSGTAEEWKSANPVLWEKEIGFEYPSEGVGKGLVKMKMGDGITPWNDLPYAIMDSYSDNSDSEFVKIEKTVDNEYFQMGIGITIYKNVCYVNIWNVIVKKTTTDPIKIDLGIELPNTYMGVVQNIMEFPSLKTVGVFKVWYGVSTQFFFVPTAISTQGQFGEHGFSFIVDTESE